MRVLKIIFIVFTAFIILFAGSVTSQVSISPNLSSNIQLNNTITQPKISDSYSNCIIWLEIEAEYEREYSLEDWIFNDDFWQVDNYQNSLVGTESTFEEWIFDESTWVLNDDTNNEYPLEDWLFDPSFFNLK